MWNVQLLITDQNIPTTTNSINNKQQLNCSPTMMTINRTVVIMATARNMLKRSWPMMGKFSSKVWFLKSRIDYHWKSLFSYCACLYFVLLSELEQLSHFWYRIKWWLEICFVTTWSLTMIAGKTKPRAIPSWGKSSQFPPIHSSMFDLLETFIDLEAHFWSARNLILI